MSLHLQLKTYNSQRAELPRFRTLAFSWSGSVSGCLLFRHSFNAYCPFVSKDRLGLARCLPWAVGRKSYNLMSGRLKVLKSEPHVHINQRNLVYSVSMHPLCSQTQIHEGHWAIALNKINKNSCLLGDKQDCKIKHS